MSRNPSLAVVVLAIGFALPSCFTTKLFQATFDGDRLGRLADDPTVAGRHYLPPGDPEGDEIRFPADSEDGTVAVVDSTVLGSRALRITSLPAEANNAYTTIRCIPAGAPLGPDAYFVRLSLRYRPVEAPDITTVNVQLLSSTGQHRRRSGSSTTALETSPCDRESGRRSACTPSSPTTPG